MKVLSQNKYEVARRAKYSSMTTEERKARRRATYIRYRAAAVEYSRKWRAENKDKYYAYVRAYEKAHPAWWNKQLLIQVIKRKAIKLQAMPKWLSKEQINEIRLIYKNCPKGHHVDHIIPLRGKGVRGLHVPWNLQYLTAAENMAKGNKYEGY